MWCGNHGGKQGGVPGQGRLLRETERREGRSACAPRGGTCRCTLSRRGSGRRQQRGWTARSSSSWSPGETDRNQQDRVSREISFFTPGAADAARAARFPCSHLSGQSRGRQDRRDLAKVRRTSLAVDDLHRQVELLNHAERDGTTARLAVVHLTLNEEGLDPGLGEHLSGAGTRRTTANDLSRERGG